MEKHHKCKGGYLVWCQMQNQGWGFYSNLKGKMVTDFPTLVLDANALLQKLFIENKDDRNINFVREIFWEDKALSILSIPINHRGGNDKLIWTLSTNGNFLVKSAYGNVENAKW